ncbi:SgcJ/EcaC family oxidoreductase [Geodermatophilus sp. YIM 151500]|uniref:SgcJ/EcaC family oxidoreductase n=1 Tax=Geodermatophilus sp. YIM 151500 TaxID=2984531 RepID=UPI0021E41CE9|nr:SgcJ/EcaC family oxidoreductase [Geodermatophilus sp. YIM 151500]MCV2487977.1 SgcJ/EcaC family oxidoreductase [Geodermatophilus sp. YIM 151500]
MTAAHPHEAQIRALYAGFLDGWNRRSGAAVSAGFADDGEIVGFDGSHTSGRLSIASDFRRIFGSHQTPFYVGLVRSVRPMAPGVAVLHAHAGMIPAGGNDLDPDLLTVHTLVAVDDGGRWKISLLQATPAAWHGRPEARDALTEELRGLLAAP